MEEGKYETTNEYFKKLYDIQNKTTIDSQDDIYKTIEKLEELKDLAKEKSDELDNAIQKLKDIEFLENEDDIIESKEINEKECEEAREEVVRDYHIEIEEDVLSILHSLK